MCEYKFRTKEKCEEKALPNSKYCILHIDFPEDDGSEEFKRINELKEKKVKDKVNKGDFNFEGAKLFKIDFSRNKIKNTLNFTESVIKINALFDGAKIDGDAWFDGAEIGGDAWFDGAEIGRDALFGGAEIGRDAWFGGAEIGRDALFGGAKIGRDALFGGAKIDGSALFDEAEIGRDARFDEAKIGRDARFDEAEIGRDALFGGAKIDGSALFDEAEIGRDASFHLTEIKGKLNFKNAKFRIPNAQELACRKAKRICEGLGDRTEVDYYFYREMEAKRKQKNLIIRLLEVPVQYIFGYGTKWERVLIAWFSVVFGLAFLFWLGNGVENANSLWENIYFSIVTATTLGYGDYHPKLGFYQGVASFEAIFGTFMWAAFIAIFARKYMR